MKICFFIHWLKAGGAERTIVNLSNYYVNNNIDVNIVLLGNYIDYDLDPRIKVFIIDNFDKKESKFKSISKMFFRIKKFKEYCSNNRPDIIVCFLPLFIFYSKFVKDIPVIGSERSNPMSYSKINKILINKLFKKANGVVFQTNSAMQCFNKKIRKKSIVIPNPLGNIYNGRKYLFNERTNKIVAIGRLHEAKDYYTLLQAFSIVTNKNKDVYLDIYGDGYLKDDLINFAKFINVINRVNFKGMNKNALQEAADAKCYILSSLYEGMPNSLLEAMGAGLPCISTNCNFGPSDIIVNGENGLLVPVRSPKELSNCILELLSNENLSNYISMNAIKVKYSYSLEKISNEYLSYFKKIIEKCKEKKNGI